MKKQLISTLVIGALMLSTPASAEQVVETDRSHNEELIGLSSGIVVGAIVGGPVGAIIGAFTGTLLGKSVGDDDALQTQQAMLTEQEQELVALNQQKQSLVELSDQYEQAQQQLTTLKMAQEQKLTELALGLNVQFKTGSSVIEPHFQQQLNDIAYAMSLSPELTLDLTGYADRRGDGDYNQALSEQRVAEVKSYLVEQGVAEERLHNQAFGDSSPLMAEQSFENDFFDRRVTLKLQNQNSALAANAAK
ncbi:sortase-associated OmpA-like protein PdsO [Shewanella schlegeliana]|uniref:Sortase-associated OmpA-like protein PdsO n=1 Tax=Shewanella schlegeliana TaxID=190308 RepID=A0ABS1SVD5_9GAMM|nr:sortase-associated OmpA-like protein PdsO [Shewanella schlegeliana]MBL4911869.1 sortase-associated OmpA-like protein PdsO [Shewanella schlegeliana]MCL1110178.1 sortase-associated OmpA-like protein PdsO [Shewanella schlegeliana]GIU27088.1 membrane protein [Shewanella schlegeliana]